MSVQAVISIEVCGVSVKSLEQARQVIVDAHERTYGKPLMGMMPMEYHNLICDLDRIGFFALRGAAAYLSKRLGVSRVTIYNALKKNNL